MKPTLMILAAGMGSRYGGLKQMDAMGPNGETVLDYSVYDAMQGGFGKVVFIIRKDIEEPFRAHVDAHFGNHVEVAYAFQELDDLQGRTCPPERIKPWGTGHAVLAGRTCIDEPFAVINADDFYGRDAYASLAKFLSTTNESKYAMVGFRLEKTLSEHGSVSRGICEVGANGQLVTVVEHLKIFKTASGAEDRNDPANPVILTGQEPASMNMWGFTPRIFEQLGARFSTFLDAQGKELKSEYLLPSEVDELIKNGEATVDVLDTESDWFGVTYPDDKPLVQANIRTLIDAGTYPEKLFG